LGNPQAGEGGKTEKIVDEGWIGLTYVIYMFEYWNTLKVVLKSG
jgi:hypothetical protein